MPINHVLTESQDVEEILKNVPQHLWPEVIAEFIGIVDLEIERPKGCDFLCKAVEQVSQRHSQKVIPQ
ncbi:hypothetical protein D0962_23165 [Leptolyngbyaceae cyanobacterium CCMR0082]|uniref:Uncharacterized protein n=1 Tax=Adonisia turfae CCMR0082 TaxID=2304604 RepID=A0A6M0SAY1_9CYAN|nr:hypothetical protein [Adonisia turfae CCMR0082]